MTSAYNAVTLHNVRSDFWKTLPWLLHTLVYYVFPRTSVTPLNSLMTYMERHTHTHGHTKHFCAKKSFCDYQRKKYMLQSHSTNCSLYGYSLFFHLSLVMPWHQSLKKNKKRKCWQSQTQCAGGFNIWRSKERLFSIFYIYENSWNWTLFFLINWTLFMHDSFWN